MSNGWLIDQEIDMQQPVSRQYTFPYGIAMTGDDRAQRLRYSVFDGQSAATLTGTLKAYFRRPDNVLIEATSTDYVSLSGNVITVQPPPEAYAKKGAVEGMLKLYATDGKIITLARFDLMIEKGVEQDDTVIPASEASRATLENRVAVLETATGVIPITNLEALSRTPATGDYMVIDDGNGPFKIDYNALASAIINKLSTNGIVGISHGGTGASTTSEALNSLGALAKAAAANEYSSSSTYVVGDYCLKNNALYKCNTGISTAETWNAAHWDETTIADEIKNIIDNFVKASDIVDGVTSERTDVPLSANQGREIWDACNLKFSDVTISNVSIGNSAYVTITSSMPTVQGTILFATVKTWGELSGTLGAFSVAARYNAAYVIGTPGLEITNLQLRFFYVTTVPEAN